MKNFIKKNIIVIVMVVAIIVAMCLGYYHIKADHDKDVRGIMMEQYFYLRSDDAEPKKVLSYHTPQRYEEIFKDGKFYIIDRVVYNMDTHNLNVYCHLKE